MRVNRISDKFAILLDKEDEIRMHALSSLT